MEYFHKWYDNYFYNFVHHQIEEEIYFPFLKTKAIMPDKVVNDHTSLIKLLDEINEKVQELKNNMFEHLAEEEQIVPTILRENFTQNEEKEIVGKIIQSLGLSGNKMTLPWIIDSMKLWCSQDKIDDLYNSLPIFIKLLYNCNWITDYKKNNIR